VSRAYCDNPREFRRSGTARHGGHGQQPPKASSATQKALADLDESGPVASRLVGISVAFGGLPDESGLRPPAAGSATTGARPYSAEATKGRRAPLRSGERKIRTYALTLPSPLLRQGFGEQAGGRGESGTARRAPTLGKRARHRRVNLGKASGFAKATPGRAALPRPAVPSRLVGISVAFGGLPDESGLRPPIRIGGLPDESGFRCAQQRAHAPTPPFSFAHSPSREASENMGYGEHGLRRAGVRPYVRANARFARTPSPCPLPAGEGKLFRGERGMGRGVRGAKKIFAGGEIFS